jgi:hypothetical protein
MSSYTSISSDKLFRLIGTALAPTMIDGRSDEEFADAPCLVPGAVRRSHRLDLSPKAPSLLTASLGLSRMSDDEPEQLSAGIQENAQRVDQQGRAVTDSRLTGKEKP